MTYRDLAEITGISESTLQSIAARRNYNTTLETVDRIAVALECPLTDLLEQVPPISTVSAAKDQPTAAEFRSGHQD